jgi:hypothetical protein
MSDTLAHPGKRKWLRRTAGILAALLIAAAVKYVVHMLVPRNFTGTGEPLPIEMPGSAFEVLYFNGHEAPRGIVILGSGSGGWSSWEEKVTMHLVAKGFAVGGWDCRKFADTRKYGRAELAAGMAAALEAVQERAGVGEVPAWYGGWSTGAEQSVAAVTSERPDGLVGLLLVAPAARGRFGLTQSDLLGIEATGPGSFGLADFIPDLKGLRVAQFAAGLDPLDSTTWFAHPDASEYQIFHLPHQLHDMGGAGSEFLKKLDEAMEWSQAAR